MFESHLHLHPHPPSPSSNHPDLSTACIKKNEPVKKEPYASGYLSNVLMITDILNIHVVYRYTYLHILIYSHV